MTVFFTIKTVPLVFLSPIILTHWTRTWLEWVITLKHIHRWMRAMIIWFGITKRWILTYCFTTWILDIFFLFPLPFSPFLIFFFRFCPFCNNISNFRVFMRTKKLSHKNLHFALAFSIRFTVHLSIFTISLVRDFYQSLYSCHKYVRRSQVWSTS